MPPATDKQLADFARAYGDLILEALDSHLYWQVNEDTTRRNDGYVLEPYTDEERYVVDVEENLRRLLHPGPSDAKSETAEGV